jgi:L-lactate dehydrogenase complex protein LldG
VNNPFGTPKNQFLDSVRKALGRTKGPPNEIYPLLNETLSTIKKRKEEAEQRISRKKDFLITELTRTAQLVGWNVKTVQNTAAVLTYIRELLNKHKINKVIRTDEKIFETVEIDRELMDSRADLMVNTQSSVQKFDPDTAELGITGADHAIAETGSVVLVSQKGSARLTSLTPSIHLALVKRSVILESLEDIYLFTRLEYYSGKEGKYMTFISGPSRTADIEQVLVVGAHGPKETHMLILDWD